MPRWIDRESSKADRVKAAREASATMHERILIERRERREFDAAMIADRAETPRVRALRPGERLLPDIPDRELYDALFDCTDEPRHLRYPHLLILRERGFTVQVWLADGDAVPTYRGDRLTEEGRRWLGLTTLRR